MIKFYQGTYSELSTADRLSSNNNICFVTDRQVLIMGGKEYGKDSGGIKIESAASYDTSNGATGTRAVADNTVFFFQGDQSLWQYKGAAADPMWVKLLDGTLSAASLISANADASGKIAFTTSGLSDGYQATAGDVASAVTTLENKVADAYTEATVTTPTSGTNTVIVSKNAGIARTAYTLNQDRALIDIAHTSGTGAAVAPNSAADTILVTETTLAEQTADILANGLEIRKFTTPETGYRATYGLYNKQTGLQLGDNINIIKDQFLKQASYVVATEYQNNWYEWGGTGDNEGWHLDGNTSAAKETGITVTKKNAER
jgi:hypothetical protein